MVTKTVLSLLVVLCAQLTNTHCSLPESWQRDNDDMEHRLMTEEIVTNESFCTFLKTKGKQHSSPNHPLQHIILKSGIHAVFKRADKENRQHGEVAAYRASKALGLDLVPPTVFRTIQGVPGSFQAYVDAPDLKRKAVKRNVYAHLDPKIVSDSKIFNYIFGRLDSKGGNELGLFRNGTYTLALIDNSTIRLKTYMKYEGPTFLCYGENLNEPSEVGSRVAYEKAQTIPGSSVEKVFRPYMSPNQARKMAKHRFVTYFIWNHKLYVAYNRHKGTRFSKEIYRSTLEALKKLDYKAMLTVWQELYHRDPEYAEALIQLTLDRRDQLLAFFKENPQGVIHH